MNKIDATKEQMVNFLLAFYKAANRSISPAKLRKISKERLWVAISSNEELLQMFYKYLENDNASNKAAHYAANRSNKAVEDTVSATELSQKLEALTVNLVACPTDFVAVWEFREFVAQLPYGVIPQETLNRVYDLLLTIDPPDIGAYYIMFMLGFMIADMEVRNNN